VDASYPQSPLQAGCRFNSVVDALDDCEDDNSIRLIRELLAETRGLQKFQLRIFLTSRPKLAIRRSFNHISEAKRQDLVLHNIHRSIVDHDISVFLNIILKLLGRIVSLLLADLVRMLLNTWFTILLDYLYGLQLPAVLSGMETHLSLPND
jgi:hypothetical protein